VVRGRFVVALLLGALIPALASPAPAASATAPATVQKPPRIASADFATRPFISKPKLSPNGEWILAMIRKAGKPTLGLLAVKSDEIRLLATPPGTDLVSYRWAGNGKILISVGKNTPWLDDEIFVTRLLAYDIAAREGKFVGKVEEGAEGDDILYVDPDGAWMLLSIQKNIFDYPSVYRVDLDTLKMKQVVNSRGDVWEWYADARGTVRAGIGFTYKKWSLVYRRTEQDKFKTAGSARYDDRKASLGLLRFTLESDDGYILSDEATGREALYRFNYATMKRGELVYESPTNDISDALLSEDGSQVRAAYYTDERDRVAWFDPKMKTLQEQLDKSVPGREAWIVSRSRDDSMMLVLVTSGNDPGIYYYFQPDEGVMRKLAPVNDKLLRQQLARTEPVSYKARDGLVIRGYLTLPAGRPAKGLPLIVMPHGGPFGVRDNGDFDPEVQFLANRGYAVLQPNYRGSESYGREFEEKGNGQWGRAMQDDLDDGMDWLVKDGIVDPKRVCIVGASYGGYAALWGATRNPERYRCAASLAGVSDIGRQLKFSRNFFTDRKSARAWQTRVQGDGSVGLDDISPLAHVDRLQVPIFLAHGKDDQTVPIKQSDLYAAALKKAGKPYEYHVYPDEGHGLGQADHLQDYFDKLETFLDRYNPAG
jgi:dipeptidyl aminopeptidase/acylaminoacyl peptidase